MSEQDKQEAKVLTDRAIRQSRQAAKNTGRAAKAAAPIVTEKVGDVAEKANDTTEAVVEDVLTRTRRFNPRILSRISGDTGIGFLALSVSIYAGVIAFNKFGSAYSQRANVVRSAATTTSHLRTAA